MTSIVNHDSSLFCSGLSPGPDPWVVAYSPSLWALVVIEDFLVEHGPFLLLSSWFLEKLGSLLFRPRIVHFGFRLITGVDAATLRRGSWIPFQKTPD